MAIIIEEEKKASGILNALGWIVILAMIGGAIYYIFFVSPTTAILPPSPGLSGLGSISQASLDAQKIVNSSEFQQLKQYIAPSSTFGSALVGRANPFVNP